MKIKSSKLQKCIFNESVTRAIGIAVIKKGRTKTNYALFACSWAASSFSFNGFYMCQCQWRWRCQCRGSYLSCIMSNVFPTFHFSCICFSSIFGRISGFILFFLLCFLLKIIVFPNIRTKMFAKYCRVHVPSIQCSLYSSLYFS